jgi:hypothetical protein
MYYLFVNIYNVFIIFIYFKILRNIRFISLHVEITSSTRKKIYLLY